MIMKDEKIHYG